MAPPSVIFKNFKHKLVLIYNCVLNNPSNVANTSQNPKLDVAIVNLTQAKVDLANSKKKKLYEWNHCFQNPWTSKLPWAKFVVGVKTRGKVMQIKCKDCNVNKGWDNLMVPKLDSLWEHDC